MVLALVFMGWLYGVRLGLISSCFLRSILRKLFDLIFRTISLSKKEERPDDQMSWEIKHTFLFVISSSAG